MQPPDALGSPAADGLADVVVAHDRVVLLGVNSTDFRNRPKNCPSVIMDSIGQLQNELRPVVAQGVLRPVGAHSATALMAGENYVFFKLRTLCG